MPPVEVVAIHEAGHAVVTVSLGDHVTKVTLVPTDQAYAAVHGDVYVPPAVIGHPTSGEVDRLTRIGRQMYAGIAAERHRYGPEHNTGGGQDIANIVKISGDLYADEVARGLWRGRVFRLAQEDVARLWPAIEDLAQDLMTAGDRDESDVRAALKRHNLL